jgi:hypothetical protein
MSVGFCLDRQHLKRPACGGLLVEVSAACTCR